jgi:hypothetical protein
MLRNVVRVRDQLRFNLQLKAKCFRVPLTDAEVQPPFKHGKTLKNDEEESEHRRNGILPPLAQSMNKIASFYRHIKVPWQ